MAISLTGGGIPCQYITATYAGTSTADVSWAQKTYTDNYNFSLPIGVVCRVTVNRVTYSDSASMNAFMYSVSLQGTCLELSRSAVDVMTSGGGEKVSVLSSSSFPITGAYKGQWQGNSFVKFLLRIE